MLGRSLGLRPVSSGPVRSEHLGAVEAEGWALAITLLQTIMQAELVALVGRELDGRLFILPRPGVAKDVIRELAAAEWATMIRLAEEHET